MDSNNILFFLKKYILIEISLTLAFSVFVIKS